MKSAMRRVKDTVYKYNEAERRIREATSSEDCPVSISLLLDITADCEGPQDTYYTMFEMLWKRVTDHEFLKHVEKGLIVVEHLLLYGNSRFREDVKRPAQLQGLKKLKRYQYFKDERDIGETVRNLADNVCKLIEDDRYLKKEIKKAQKHPTFGSNRFGTASFKPESSDSSSDSPSPEPVKKKKKKKKKKRRKDRESANETFSPPQFAESGFTSSAFATTSPSKEALEFPAPKPTKMRSPQPKPQRSAFQQEPPTDMMFDPNDISSKFLAPANGKAEPSVFDDFLTGGTPAANAEKSAEKSGFFGFGFEEKKSEETSTKSEVVDDKKKGNESWISGGSKLIDLQNPLDKPKSGTLVRKKEGPSMAQMEHNQDIARAINPVQAKPTPPQDPFAQPKHQVDPFAAYVGGQPVVHPVLRQPMPQPQPGPFGQPAPQPFAAQPFGQPAAQPFRQAPPQPFGQSAFSNYGQPQKQDPFKGLFE